MNRKILIDGTNSEETRVALVDDGVLTELSYKTKELIQLRGNIYVAFVSRIEPSLQAAFVDYNGGKSGFLPFDEVSHEYYCGEVPHDYGNRKNRVFIQDVLFVGQKLLVQVIKDERRNKGVTMTTYATLTGRFCNLVPNVPYDERKYASIDKSNVIKLPDSDITAIIKPGVADTSSELLRCDYERLLKVWSNIERRTSISMTPTLLYEEGDAVKRAVNEYIHDIREVVVDSRELYKDIMEYANNVFYSAHDKQKIRLHNSHLPLFTHYNIETQIDNLYTNIVYLSSGGYLVVGITEALVAIDVNSGRMTRETSDMESTALKTNIEAVREVAKQLRLRNLSGIIVIDLISMVSYTNKLTVESELKKAMLIDRARSTIGKINEFGLLILSRQRVGTGFHEFNSTICSYCRGAGALQSIRSMAGVLYRSLRQTLEKHKARPITIQLSKDLMAHIATHSVNLFSELEKSYGVKLIYEISKDLGKQNFLILLDNAVIEPDMLLSDENIMNGLMEEYLETRELLITD